MIEPALKDLSPVDRTFLLRMAVDDEPSKMADIAQRLDADSNYTSQYRLRLIAAGLIVPAVYATWTSLCRICGSGCANTAPSTHERPHLISAANARSGNLGQRAPPLNRNRRTNIARVDAAPEIIR